MNQHPIFLLGAHKSGTSLLRSLFDGHSGLFVIPNEAHFFQHLGYWVDYKLRRSLPRPDLTIDEIKNRLVDWIEYSNRVFHPQADSDTRGLWDVAKFREVLEASLPAAVNEKEMIESYVTAMYASLYHEKLSDQLRIVEKSVENAEFAIQLKSFYPEARMIHIVRNPYSNIVSIRKYKTNDGRFPSLKRIVAALYNSYYFLDKNRKIIGDDYFIVRYEDLVQNPEAVISRMVKFLGIANEDILTRPTLQGKAWQGNSTTAEKFSGISSKTLNNWKRTITPLEVNLVNRLFSSVLAQYDYEKLPDGPYLRRNKKEALKTYISNRLLYKYYL